MSATIPDQLARGAELRFIAQDLTARIAKLEGESLARFARVITVEIDIVLHETGSFKDKDKLKQLSGSYLADARRSYKFDISSSAAKALIATLLEAAALPGDDALYVRDLTENIAALAIKKHAGGGHSLEF
jgi:hypothetical protein